MYYRAWKKNDQQGGIDFMGKYNTHDEAMQHGDFCDYVDGEGVHVVLDNGKIVQTVCHIDRVEVVKQRGRREK